MATGNGIILIRHDVVECSIGLILHVLSFYSDIQISEGHIVSGVRKGANNNNGTSFQDLHWLSE